MKRTLISLLMTAAMLLSLLAGIPLRTSAAEQTEPAITLSIDGDRLNAQCAGLPANARIIAAGYDGSGQMKTVEVRTGKTPGFAYDRQYGYRVFAVDPDTSKPLCEATSRVTLFSGEFSGMPYIGGTAENGSAVASATRAAVRQSLNARVALEELLAVDFEAAAKDPDKLKEAQDKLDKAMAAYEDMEEAGAVLWAVAEKQAEKEAKKQAAATQACDGVSLQASNSELVRWAEDLTRQYDRIEGNKKMAELGKMMGCDARTAYQQFVVAQEILNNKYMGEANTATNIINGLTVIKTGCKVGMFVGSIIATGGVSAVGAAGMVVGGTDCLIEITNTGATLIYGDESKEAELVSNITKPVSDFCYIYSLLTMDTTKMSDGEIIAALGDWYQSVKDHYGEVIDKLDGIEPDKDKDGLKGNVTREEAEPEDVEEMILPEDDTGTDDGKTPNEDALKDAKKDLEKDLKDEDKEITDEDLEEILKDGDVLDKDKRLKDFNDTKKKDFEKEVIIRIKEKEPPKPKPDDPTPTPPPEYPIFHDDGPGQQHREVYWENEHGKFGLYERYYEDVLVDRTFYDDEGVIKWSTHYYGSTPEKPGRVYLRRYYSNGEEVGSVISETHYYYEPDDVALFPEGVTEQVYYTTYQIVETYYNEEKSSDDTRWVWYYESPHLTYDPYGNLVEERTGEGTHWKMQKVYDKEGNLSVQTEDNGDGTHTRTHFFTKQQSNYFKNLGDPWMRGVYTHENDYTGYLNMPPGDGELVKSERWQVEDYWEESDGNGNRTVSFGYRHTIEYPERSESFIWKGDVPE